MKRQLIFAKTNRRCANAQVFISFPFFYQSHPGENHHHAVQLAKYFNWTFYDHSWVVIFDSAQYARCICRETKESTIKDMISCMKQNNGIISRLGVRKKIRWLWPRAWSLLCVCDTMTRHVFEHIVNVRSARRKLIVSNRENVLRSITPSTIEDAHCWPPRLHHV